MRFRFVIPLLGASALAFAYASPSPSHPSETARRAAARGDTITGSLDVRVGESVTFTFHVTNESPKRVEVRFPSGKTHELVVLDPVGREVWRWSSGRLFTQAIQNKVLGTSDTLTFNETWRPNRAGTYTAVATLLSENYPVEQRVAFALPSRTLSAR